MPYVQSADRLHCPPWELIDEPTPRHYWYKVGLIMADAENEIERRRANKAEFAQAGADMAAKARGAH